MDNNKPDDRTTVLTLKEPIQIGSQTVSEIRFRPIRGKHLKGLKLVNIETIDPILTLASRLSGETDLLFDSMGVEDLAAVQEIVTGFLLSGPRITKTSSADSQ